MPFDHALGCEEDFDLFPELSDIAVFLEHLTSGDMTSQGVYNSLLATPVASRQSRGIQASI